LRFGLEEVCFRGEGGCEERAKVSVREGFVLGESADGAAGQCDVR
jgi:hypothetical protein